MHHLPTEEPVPESYDEARSHLFGNIEEVTETERLRREAFRNLYHDEFRERRDNKNRTERISEDYESARGQAFPSLN